LTFHLEFDEIVIFKQQVNLMTVSPQHPFQYKAIKYAIIVQNLLFILMAVSLFGVAVLFAAISPLDNQWGVWILWALIWAFLLGVYSYLQFWWAFSFKTSLIQVYKVNAMLYKSAFWAIMTVYLLVLLQSGEFNYLYLALIAAILTAYHHYSATD
jgi:hypothetical protein